MGKVLQLISRSDRKQLVSRLRSMPESVDSLPYTEAFDRLRVSFNEGRLQPLLPETFWLLIVSIRKQGLNRATSVVPAFAVSITKEEAEILKTLIPRSRGEVDRLPYSEKFGSLKNKFSNQTQKQWDDATFWRIVLRAAKAGINQEARLYLDKALRSAKKAVNEFNSVDSAHRSDSVLIWLHHACEMMLKAALRQRSYKIKDADTGHTAGFFRCVEWGRTIDNVKFLSYDDSLILLAVDRLRGYAYHDVLELDETELYLYAARTIEILNGILGSVFNTSLADHLPARVLPICTVPMNNVIVLLDRKKEQLLQLLRSNDRRRAVASVKSLFVLEEIAREGDPQQASDSVASVVLSKLKRGSSIDSLFSGVARIELTVPESTSTKISLLLRGKIGTPVQGAKVADGDPAIAYRDIDPKSVFTLRHTELCQKTGLNSAQVTALIAELGLKNRSDCCYVFGPNAAKSPTPGYSAKAIEIIRNEVKKGPEVLKAIVSKHSSRRIHKSK